MLDRQLVFAKALRRDMTDAERKLWLYLRANRLQDCKFKRQQPIGPYIVDFVCLSARLIVELDGGQHLESAADMQRDLWLANNGFRVLRFWNDQALHETDAVLESILEAVEKLPPLPNPSPARGEGL